MMPDRTVQVGAATPVAVAESFPDLNLEALFATSHAVVNDALIEHYVRYPEYLPAGIRRVIEDLLAEDDGARQVESFYRAFYEELDCLPARTSSRLETFIDSIFPSSDAVPLFPVDDDGKRLHSVLCDLVPVTTSAGVKRLYEPVHLLTSKTARAVASILRDSMDSSHFRIQVLTDEPSRRKNIIVTFPDLDVDVFAAEGCGEFDLQDSTDDLNLFESAILRFPKYEARRHNQRFSSRLLDTGELNSLCLPTGHSLSINASPVGQKWVLEGGGADYPTLLRRVVVKTRDRGNHIIRIADGQGDIEFDEPVEHAWIGFYE